MKNRIAIAMAVSALALALQGCATAKVAQSVKYIGFEESHGEPKSVGNVEGKDCTWRLFGYELGESPSTRKAFKNAAERTEDTLTSKKQKQGNASGTLSGVSQVAVDQTGFSAWIVGRSCLVVTGVGYQ